MKKTNLFLMAFLIMGAMFIWSFRTPAPAFKTYQWKEVATLESAVGAGLGRSRTIETTVGNSQLNDKYEMENIFSATGINVDNVQQNEKTIIQIITDMQDDGWELFSITSNTLSTDTKRQRLFITRYLFRRPV